MNQTIRNAYPSEYEAVGQLLVDVYAQLDGFPKPNEQPNYYQMLAQVGNLTERPGTEIVVAVNDEDKLTGAVVYFDDMQYYGSGGTATKEINAAGFILLGVDATARGRGIGQALTQQCIDKARNHQRQQLIIHTTNAMQTAWRMYERMGFARSADLDFMQDTLAVFGFRMALDMPL